MIVKRKATWTIVDFHLGDLFIYHCHWLFVLIISLSIIPTERWEGEQQYTTRIDVQLYKRYICNTRTIQANLGGWICLLRQQCEKTCWKGGAWRSAARSGGCSASTTYLHIHISAARTGECSASTSYQLIPTAATMSTQKRKQ